MFYASCDSLEMKCTYYARRASAYKSEAEKLKKMLEAEKAKKQPGVPPWAMIVAFMTGGAGGWYITYNYITKRRKDG